MPQQVWTMEQVARLIDRQLDRKFHPYTCGNRSDHPVVMGDKGVLIPTIYGWICPFCDYRQDWAHEMDLMTQEEWIAKLVKEKLLVKQEEPDAQDH